MKYNFLLDAGVKLVLGVAIIVLFIFHIDSGDKLVYVDSQKLVSGYKGAQAAKKEFEAKSVEWQANLDSLRTELEARVADYNSKKSKLSVKEQQLTEELLASKKTEFINYQQAIQDKVRSEDQALTLRVLGQVNEFLKKYGKEKGYKIILAATQYGNIVYADQELDVTNEAMERLNAQYK